MVIKFSDESLWRLEKFTENLRSRHRRVASLEQGDWQPRLAMEADGPADTRTRERMDGAATVIQAIHGDRCSANRVQVGPKTTSTSFVVNGEPSALPCRDDVVVENGVATPKSCVSPLEMRTTSAAGSLLPTVQTTTATWTTLDRPTLWFYLDKKNELRASTPFALYNGSFWRNTLLTAPSCRRVIETKSGQNRMFHLLGGSEGRVRACPFYGTWCVVM